MGILELTCGGVKQQYCPNAPQKQWKLKPTLPIVQMKGKMNVSVGKYYQLL